MRGDCDLVGKGGGRGGGEGGDRRAGKAGGAGGCACMRAEEGRHRGKKSAEEGGQTKDKWKKIRDGHNSTCKPPY